MTLHPPRRISSIEGLGLNTTKIMRRINDSVSIGTEIWNELNEPWKESDTIIALPGYKWVTKWEVGKPYVITKFLDEKNNLIAVYCDVSRPVSEIKGGFEFIDLYLDVFQLPGQKPVLLDEDELNEAVSAKCITPEEATEARQIANSLMLNLTTDPGFLKF